MTNPHVGVSEEEKTLAEPVAHQERMKTEASEHYMIEPGRNLGRKIDPNQKPAENDPLRHFDNFDIYLPIQ